jgi:hypothetical protein
MTVEIFENCFVAISQFENRLTVRLYNGAVVMMGSWPLIVLKLEQEHLTVQKWLDVDVNHEDLRHVLVEQV